MSWVSIVAPPCTCADRPTIINAQFRQVLLDKGITVGSRWQCDMPDCNKVWEIVVDLGGTGTSTYITSPPGWAWRRVLTPTGGSLE